ncbi:MAG: CRISPR-associated endonuclease Cas2 [Myxococcota bacterium]
MGQGRNWFLVSYDVRDPKRLRRVHKLLTVWGEPLQYSLFRVRMSAVDYERFRLELSREVAPEDSVLFIRLCASCSRGFEGEGDAPSFDPDPPPFTIIG